MNKIVKGLWLIKSKRGRTGMLPKKCQRFPPASGMTEPAPANGVRVPLKRLELQHNFRYTDARFKNLHLAQHGTKTDLKGNRQIFTPDITSMLAVQYSLPIAKKQLAALVLRSE